MPVTRTSGQGRPKGTKNKATAEIKAMIEAALVNKGGVAYLERQADENPTAFMGLIGKILPKEVNANVEGGMTINWPLPRTPLDG